MRGTVVALRRVVSLLVALGVVLSAIAVTVPATRIAYAGAYDTAVNGDHPAGYWRLGESTGTTAADASGGNHPGTYSGSFTLGAAGAIIGDSDTAVSLTGGSVQTTYTQTSVTSYTAEAWVKTTAAGGFIVRDRGVTSGTSGKSLTLGINSATCPVNGAPYFGVESDSLFVGVQTAVAVNDGSWHHIAGTFSGTSGQNAAPSQFLVYIDGRAVPGESCVSGNSAPPFTGLDGTTLGTSLTGTLDEAAVYTSALTASQIRNHATVAGYMPGAPSGVSATAGSGQATVSWTAPTSTGATALASYTVSAHDGSAVTAAVTVPASSTTATLAGLKGGTAYTFTVSASNSYGTSVDSAASTSITTTGTATAYPMVVVGDSPAAYYRLDDGAAPLADSSGRGNLLRQSSGTSTFGAAGAIYGDSRTALTASGGTLVSNYVQPGVNAFSAEAWIKTAATGAATIYSDRGINLTNGKSLTLGIGSSSCSTTAGTPWFALESDSTWIGVQGSSAINNGSWHHVVGVFNGGSSATAVAPSQFTLYVDGSAVQTTSCQTGTGTTPLAGQDTARIGSGFNGSLDEVAVYESALSATQVVTHWNTGGYVPSAPQNAQATVSQTTATVTWAAPASQGSSAIAGYTVTPYVGSTAGAAQQLAASATSATFSNLTPGTTYTFQVVAKNGTGPGAIATTNAVTVVTAPGAPGNVTATSGNAASTVSWSAASSNGATITGYTITPYVGTTAGSPTSVSGTTLSTTIGGLTNGTTYTFQVTATNSVGSGPAGISNAVTVGAPAPPSNVSATAGVNQATVTWTASSAGSPSPTNYLVTAYRGTTAVNSVGTGSSATSVIIGGLAGGTAYTFRVTAQNSAGSAYSTSSSVTPSGTASTYATTVLGDGPVAYYRLGEQSGTLLADSSGNSNQGTANGGVTLGASGAPIGDPDTAISLNGSNGYVSAPTLTALQGSNTRSVEMWFSTTNGSQQPLFDSGSTNTTDQAFEIFLTQYNGVGNSPPQNTPGLSVSFWGDGVFIPGLYLADGRMHHLVVSLSGKTYSVYVDGKTPPGSTYTGSGWSALTGQPFTLLNNPNTAGNPVWLGQSRGTFYGNGSTYFQGTLDEVAIYPTALTATQVTNHEQAAGVIPAAPTNVTATAGSNQATINWTSNTPAAALPGYVVTAYAGGAPKNAVSVASSATSATIAGLQAGVSYTFTVAATNTFGSASASSAAVTPTGSATTYASTVQGDGPSIYWRLGDGSGSQVAADSSGNGRVGGYQGSAGLGNSGALVGDATTSFGRSDAGAYMTYLQGTGAPVGSSARSVEAWFRTSDTTDTTRSSVGASDGRATGV